jgi:3-methyl-2-oxobutanoate hydroxymethyltransferase
MSEGPKRVTVPWVAAAPERGERLVMVTAYDFPQGRTADAAGVDLVLVGDSLAMVVLGHADTLAVTLDEMLHHVKAVRRGVERALLVADMPYGSFHLGPEQAVASALRFVKEGGAQAVKIEGDRPEVTAALVRAEVPVMAHLGLTPQSLHKLGGYRVQGRGEDAGQQLLKEAKLLEQAGAGMIVLEAIPAALAAAVTEALKVPTIGIGAGVDCAGQVLVLHDMLDVYPGRKAKFVKNFMRTTGTIQGAIELYVKEVKARTFPGPEHSF